MRRLFRVHGALGGRLGRRRLLRGSLLHWGPARGALDCVDVRRNRLVLEDGEPSLQAAVADGNVGGRELLACAQGLPQGEQRVLDEVVESELGEFLKVLLEVGAPRLRARAGWTLG